MFIQPEENTEQLNGTSPSSLPDISSAKGSISGWASEAFTLCTFMHNWFHLARLLRAAYSLQLLWLLLGHGCGCSALPGAYNLILPCYSAMLLCQATVRYYREWWNSGCLKTKMELQGKVAQAILNTWQSIFGEDGGGVWVPRLCGLILQFTLVLGGL